MYSTSTLRSIWHILTTGVLEPDWSRARKISGRSSFKTVGIEWGCRFDGVDDGASSCLGLVGDRSRLLEADTEPEQKRKRGGKRRCIYICNREWIYRY